jgi:hypothetical protein
VFLGHLSAILSGILDILSSQNLTLIRLAHFISGLIKIIIYIDLFNNILFYKYAILQKNDENDLLSKRLSTREICSRTGLFLSFTLFTYLFSFFPFNGLPIDFFGILAYDLFASKHFELTLDLEGARKKYFEPIVLIKRMTFDECILYLTCIKFAYFSLKYLYMCCGYDVFTLLLEKTCDFTLCLQPHEVGSRQNWVILKIIYKQIQFRKEILR